MIAMIEFSSSKVLNTRNSSNTSIVCTDTRQDPPVLVSRVYISIFECHEYRVHDVCVSSVHEFIALDIQTHEYADFPIL